ncbi:MAG: hypothetical protein ACYTGC_20710, partial [Planctomycetota bacterium]
VWMFNSVSVTAPAGTQRVEAMFIFVQGLAGEAGAVFVDDVVFQQEQPADFDVNLLDNPNFDGMPLLSGWSTFGNAFASAPDETALSQPVAGKMFGNFLGGSECGDCADPDPNGLPGCSDLTCQDTICAIDPFCCETAWDGICAAEAIQLCDCSAVLNVTGLFQALPSVEGETYGMTGWSLVRSADPIPPTPMPQGNWAVMKIAFFDAPAGGTEIGGGETLIADGSSPQDVWMLNSVSATAPAGTQRVEALLLFLQGELDAGAVFVDNVTLELTAASPCVGDIDGDGQVGVTDFLALLAAWGPNPGHPADLDGNGDVGVTDFLALLAAWGPCP